MIKSDGGEDLDEGKGRRDGETKETRDEDAMFPHALRSLRLSFSSSLCSRTSSLRLSFSSSLFYLKFVT